jgi:tRNA (guanine-N7-)-methyltransferase
MGPEGIIHLKTDNKELHEYTLSVIAASGLKVHVQTDNLYESDFAGEILSIKTHYEKMFLMKGIPITYIQFELDKEIKPDIIGYQE